MNFSSASSNFLKDIVKETGNEYAGLVSDGIEAGDVESFIDSGSYALNAFYREASTEGSLQTKLPPLLENRLQEKHFSYWVLSNSFCQIILAVVLFTLSLNLQ